MRTLRPLMNFEAQRQVTSAAAARARVAVVLAAILFMSLVYAVAMARTGQPIGIGLEMVSLLVGLNYLLVLLSGASLFASAITEERDAGTLPLLVTAGVPLRTIVAGKGAARLVPVVSLIVVQLPLLFGAFGFGGFLISQLVPALVLLGTLTLAVFAWGMLVSTLSLRSSTAQTITFAGLLLVEFGPIASRAALLGTRLPGWMRTPLTWLSQRSAMSTAESLRDIFNGLVGFSWWPPLATGHLLFAAVTLVMTIAVAEPWLQRTFRYEPRIARPLGQTKPSRLTVGDAVLAREFRFGVGGVAGLGIRLLIHIAAVLAAALVLRQTDWVFRQPIAARQEETARTFLLVLTATLTLFDLWVRIGRFLARESIDRTLAPIVLTGMAIPSLILRKAIASLAVLLPGIVVFAAVMMLAPGDRSMQSLWSEIDRGGTFWLLVGFALQAVCVGHLTMWLSLRAPLQSFALGAGIGGAVAVALLMVSFVAQQLIDPRADSARVAGQCLTYLSLIELIALHRGTVNEAIAVAGE